MITIPLPDPIDFLVSVRFPAAHAMRANSSRSTSQREYLARADSYREELQKLDTAALRSAYAEAMAAKQRLELEQRRQEEAARPFNQSHAVADFEHWARQAYWSLDEGAALLLGRSPAYASSDICKPLRGTSEFADSYLRLRETIGRSAATKQLTDPLFPGLFLAWAKRLQLPIAPELESAVLALGVVIADWQSVYETLKEAHDILQRAHSTAQAAARQQQDALNGRIVELESEAAALRAAATAAAASRGKGLDPRQFESLRKLVIGMAVGGYGYRKGAVRTDIVSAIVSDLALAGVALSPDAVHAHLGSASELLPLPEPPAARPPAKR